MLVYNISTNSFEDRRYLNLIIVSINNNCAELGYCSSDDPRAISCFICFEDCSCEYILNTEENIKQLVYSNRKGCYVFRHDMSDLEVLKETTIFGRGGFPYRFERFYEAVNCFGLFDNKQNILNNVEYPISKYLKYTFGLEFETYAGYIPQETCFRDGLIPLRDGSLDGGIEYSTIVLKGNSGINLLKQQLDTLKKYTYFNKECSLHFHLGGYPVNERSIWALYVVWKVITPYINRLVPKYTFETAKYKNSHKDYCKHLPTWSTFGQMYSFIAGQKYFGSLTQVHPDDPERRAKWNVHSRYYELNLLNMVCYTSPKTVEFRFLRPTFNMHKILLWLYIFNAIMLYSENLAADSKTYTEITRKASTCSLSLEKIICAIYPSDLSDKLIQDIVKLEIIIYNQTMMNDFIGTTTEIENNILDPDEII